MPRLSAPAISEIDGNLSRNSTKGGIQKTQTAAQVTSGRRQSTAPKYPDEIDVQLSDLHRFACSAENGVVCVCVCVCVLLGFFSPILQDAGLCAFVGLHCVVNKRPVSFVVNQSGICSELWQWSWLMELSTATDFFEWNIPIGGCYCCCCCCWGWEQQRRPGEGGAGEVCIRG